MASQDVSESGDSSLADGTTRLPDALREDGTPTDAAPAETLDAFQDSGQPGDADAAIPPADVLQDSGQPDDADAAIPPADVLQDSGQPGDADAVLPSDTLQDSGEADGADSAALPDAGNEEPPCVPDCLGKQCGPDGCGNVCGECDDGDGCTVDSCGEGGDCTHSPMTCDGSPCDDQCNPFPVVDDTAVKIVASFEEGVDEPWQPGAPDNAPHYWTSLQPAYSYAHAAIPNGLGWWGTINPAWEPPAADNVNWWHTLPPKNAGFGYTDCDYRLVVDNGGPGWTTNYQDWSFFDTLQVRWMAGNPDNEQVHLEVFAHHAGTGQWTSLFSQWRKRDVVHDELLNLGSISGGKNGIDMLKFRVFNEKLPAGADHNHFQRTHLYRVRVARSGPPETAFSIGGRTVRTRFLGSVLHKRYGAYSASGFYDHQDGKYKLWFGGGIPEADSCDNVWYVESASMGAEGEDLRATRILLETNGVLWPSKGPKYGYGGDPSVIRLQGEAGQTGYVMYFSGLPMKDPSWNEIYRAVSPDGVSWTLEPKWPVVAAPTSGVAGYGTGSPSVIFRDGVFHLYYYSQSEQWGGKLSPGSYRRTSSNGIDFSITTLQKVNIDTAIDVTWVDALQRWVGTYYWHAGGSSCLASDGVGIAISQDGINFAYDPGQQIAQDAPMCLCHNPGFVRGRLGNGYRDMYVTFGASENPLGLTEYFTRQLEYSSMRIE